MIVPLLAASSDSSPAENPRELGKVNWGRNLNQALVQSKSTGKPVALLFQEIPGCATCVNFGRDVLSHPLLVDALEHEFVPLAIHNNKPGEDAAVLKRFNEPAWNNPVLRLIDADGRDLIARKDGVWSPGGIAQRMITALEAADRSVPAYLRLAAAELGAATPERATFAMHCFWDGEAKLGGIDGVLSTRAGWMDGHEVVEITFDSRTVTYVKLLDQAQQMQCATAVFAQSDSQFTTASKSPGSVVKRTNDRARDTKTEDRKFALRQSPMRFLPLTPIQAARVNADLRFGRDAQRWLSPSQVGLLSQINALLKADLSALDHLNPDEIETNPSQYEAKLNAALRRAP